MSNTDCNPTATFDNTTTARVVAAIPAHGCVTAAQIAVRTELPLRTVAFLLPSLAAAGVIERGAPMRCRSAALHVATFRRVEGVQP